MSWTEITRAQHCRRGLRYVTNPAIAPYWERISVGHALAGKPMDVPMLHIGGWYDFMLNGTLRIFEAIKLLLRPSGDTNQQHAALGRRFVGGQPQEQPRLPLSELVGAFERGVIERCLAETAARLVAS